MRQVAPWGKPVTNPGAFGAGADDETFGSRLRMPGLTPDQVRLGDAPDSPAGSGADMDADDRTARLDASPWMEIGKGALAVALGGALVGFLASGGRGWRGAAIGATTNLTLFYGGTLLAGRGTISTGNMAALGALTVASAGGAGYFFMQQRRRK